MVINALGWDNVQVDKKPNAQLGDIHLDNYHPSRLPHSRIPLPILKFFSWRKFPKVTRDCFNSRANKICCACCSRSLCTHWTVSTFWLDGMVYQESYKKHHPITHSHWLWISLLSKYLLI